MQVAGLATEDGWFFWEVMVWYGILSFLLCYLFNVRWLGR